MVAKHLAVASLVLAWPSQGFSTSVSAGNDLYEVAIDPERNGAFTVGTGHAHPVTVQEGERSLVLGGGDLLTGGSFFSLRSHSSSRDYFMGLAGFLEDDGDAFDCVPISSVTTPLVTFIEDAGRVIGVSALWEIRGSDELDVEESLVAVGDSLSTAAARITLDVTNRGASPVRIGVREAWSLGVGNSGGSVSPAIGLKPPEPAEEPLPIHEFSLEAPAERSFIVSNEERPSDPGPVDDNRYVVEGTVGGIPLVPPPTPPDRFLFTKFGDVLRSGDPRLRGVLNSCFGYEIDDPPRQAFHATNTAVVYFWGERDDTAIEIAPGESASFTQYVFAYLDWPLRCDAGRDRIVECEGESTSIVLDGTGSDNVRGEGIAHLWSAGPPAIGIAPATAERPELTVSGLGTVDVDLLVHRGGFASSCETTVEVVDTTPPLVESASASPSILWPPDHRWVEVTVAIEAVDACAGPVSAVLRSVESSEPAWDQGRGSGRTVVDVRGADVGTSDFSIWLRAERDGTRRQRVYTLVYGVEDAAGNETIVPLEVVVPHDQRSSR